MTESTPREKASTSPNTAAETAAGAPGIAAPSRVPEREGPGSVLGPYKLLQLLGEGGFGRVYEAEQREPVRRRVALKILKPGMETDQVLARFEAERQALAVMDHPGIAKVFSAGTTESGRPYFVMELVKGVPITDYCDSHASTPRARLELFVKVCHAVQHAHQKGIIHRDLKPSNVLVSEHDDQPTPKVIDFGIAKAISGRLGERTVHTEIHQFIGTPEYVSPEQAQQSPLDIDTRSDIYSLGVLLYHLLTGVTPFDTGRLRAASHAEILRILRDEEAPKPSTRVRSQSQAQPTTGSRRLDRGQFAKLLRGDLDWITMKALDKDRARRYDSASALAADVERHLRHEPVLAGPPSATYRLAKLVRRHRWGVAAGAAVASALVLGVIGTTWGMLRAADEGREAKRQAAIARAVNSFLTDDLLAAAAPSSERGRGREATVREVLDVAAERLSGAGSTPNRFAGEPQVEIAILSVLGSTYDQLGDYKAAEPHLERAVGLARATFGEHALETARATGLLGWLHHQQGRFDEAEREIRAALESYRKQVGPDDPGTLMLESNLATTYRWQGRYREAEEHYRHCFEVAERVLGKEHPDTLNIRGNLANHLQETGRVEEAERLHREELAIRERTEGKSSPGVVATLNNLANDLGLLGRYAEAEPLMRRTLDTKREMYGAEHPSTLNSLSNLAETLFLLGRFAEAERLHRETLAGRSRALGEDHRRTLSSRERLALVLVTLERFAEGERLADAAASRCVEILGEPHPDCLWAHDTRGAALLGLGRANEAEPLLRRQIALVDELRQRGEEKGERDSVLPSIRLHLGLALGALGRHAEGEPFVEEGAAAVPASEATTPLEWAKVAGFYRAWAEREPSDHARERAAHWSERARSWRGGR